MDWLVKSNCESRRQSDLVRPISSTRAMMELPVVQQRLNASFHTRLHSLCTPTDDSCSGVWR